MTIAASANCTLNSGDKVCYVAKDFSTLRAASQGIVDLLIQAMESEMGRDVPVEWTSATVTFHRIGR